MNIRPFQIALLAGFAILAILSIFLVKIYKPTTTVSDWFYGERVVVWGSVDTNIFKNIQNQIKSVDPEFDSIEYYYVDPREFDNELVNAIAEGRSPDLIFLRSDALVKHRAKLLPIPYDSLPLRDFKDTYVDAGEIFALPEGIYALPFMIDPLVMYWNRDLLATAGFAQPPTTWESVVANYVPALTTKDNSRNILQSAIAFGEYRNVKNAKDMIMALAMQSGSSLVTVNERGYSVDLDKAQASGERPPLTASVEFYTDFSNANSPLYTWNRAQPVDENAFVSEDLAIYFGKGSEAENIAGKNPNLNFDVAMIPQGAAATVKRTSADVYGLAIPRGAFNAQGAYAAARTLSSAENSRLFAQAIGMSSAHRSVINEGDSNPLRQVILRSALVSRSWLDPEVTKSNAIFQALVEDVVSSRNRVSSAVSDAVRKLSFEY